MAADIQQRCRGRILAWLGLFLGLGMAGCRTGGLQGIDVVLFSLEDRASQEFADFELPEQLLRQLAERELMGNGYFHLLKQPVESAYRLEISVAAASEKGPSAVDDPSLVYRSLQVDCRLWRRWQQQRQEFSASERAYQGQALDDCDRQEGFERVLRRALRSCLQWLQLQQQASTWSSERLAEQLRDKDPRRRYYLLRVLRERRVPELVPQIIEMLNDNDNEVVLEAVGVLVAQHDQRAVLPLIRISRGRDLLFLSQIVTAVGSLGGVQARGYLFTLAAGHPVEQIRRLAAETLDRLLHRQGGEPGSARTEQALVMPAGSAQRTRDNGGEP